MTHALAALAVAAVAAVGLLTGCTPWVDPPPPPPAVVVVTPPSERLGAVPYTEPPTVTGVYPRRCTVQHSPSGALLPDPACTPGSVAPSVTEATEDATVCRSGWTATVRPGSRITAKVKTQAMTAYGIPPAQRDRTEFDHLVPLALGGSNDITNLWPQPSDLPPPAGVLNTKDHLEERLADASCEDRIELAAAQQAIAADWTTAAARLGVPIR